MSIHRPANLITLLGGGALAGVVVFAVTCATAQFLRSDLDWLYAPLSFYLIGPGGETVKAAYAVLSAAIAAIGIGCYRTLEPAARSAAPLLLFLLAAAALDATALFDTATGSGAFSLHAFLHNLAALTTFVSITTAMLVQAWRFRRDPIWRPRFAFALGLAIAAFTALSIYGLSHVLPRGLMQKTVIVLILAWLACAAAWLMRAARRA